MIEVFSAFVFGALIPCGLLVHMALVAARQNARYDKEIAALLDRVQSPDLASYYGARAAYHPDEFPAPPPVDLIRDEFGYVEEPRDPNRLPGELPSSEL